MGAMFLPMSLEEIKYSLPTAPEGNQYPPCHKSGKGSQPTQALRGEVRIGQARRQPDKKRKPRLFWTGVEVG